MVEHFKRVSAHAFFNPRLCGNYAILIATFNASLKCFGDPLLRPLIKGTGQGQKFC